jgi:hypothetical protein
MVWLAKPAPIPVADWIWDMQRRAIISIIWFMFRNQGITNLIFRVASERASSQLIIRIGEGNSFTAVDTVTINGTGGWQTWKTISSTAHFLKEDIQCVCMSGRANLTPTGSKQ